MNRRFYTWKKILIFFYDPLFKLSYFETSTLYESLSSWKIGKVSMADVSYLSYYPCAFLFSLNSTENQPLDADENCCSQK